MKESKDKISWQDFAKVEMCIGTIISVEWFKEARNPAYKLLIDFGELGHLKSSAQITTLYKIEELLNRQIVAVVNFPPKQIANMMSECLVLGGIGEGKDVILLQPDQSVKNGTRIG